MMIVMIVFVLVTRFRPITLDKYITAIALLPPWRDPDGSASRWEFPMPWNPLVPAVTVGPISGDPDVVAGGTIPFNNHFVARCRGRSEVNIQVDRCCNQVWCEHCRAAAGKRRERTCGDESRQAITENELSEF